MTEVVVAGVGMIRFGRYPERTIGSMGAEACSAALTDAGLKLSAVQRAYCGASPIGPVGVSPGTRVLSEMANVPIPVINIDNASASSASAFYWACQAITREECDVVLVIGVGKMGVGIGGMASDPVEERLEQARGVLPPAGYLAMTARRRMHDYGATIDDYALVSVKNHKHASENPFAQRQKIISLDDVHGARMIADPLTALHCCPISDGAAAAVVVSGPVAARLGISPRITVTGASFRTETYTASGHPAYHALTAEAAREAYALAGSGPEDVDLVQVHDAFTVEEVVYYESLGFCPVGEGEKLLAEGATTIGGRIPFNTDGGLLARGHPIGPTGLAQVWETAMQLRGVAGSRQVEGAKLGVVSMLGGGTVSIVHILRR